MRRLESLFRFAWEFVVGEDWRIAVGVTVALAATALAGDAGLNAWWMLPLAVAVLLAGSVWSVARSRR